MAKVYGTRYSQAVTHPSTNRARRCLTSVIGREPVLSTWYGRRRQPAPTSADPPHPTATQASLHARLRASLLGGVDSVTVSLAQPMYTDALQAKSHTHRGFAITCMHRFNRVARAPSTSWPRSVVSIQRHHPTSAPCIQSASVDSPAHQPARLSTVDVHLTRSARRRFSAPRPT
jgi:hypothetical protein